MELFLREATERIGVDDPLLDWPGVPATRKLEADNDEAAFNAKPGQTGEAKASA